LKRTGLALIAACGLAASGATAAASSAKAPRCEKVTVSGQHWGVYVAEGRITCAAAGAVVKAVLSGHGKSVDGSPDGNVAYDGWYCPYDQMGSLDCQYGTKPGRTIHIFAENCVTATGALGCPAREPDDA
jgi:hypothetical protein